MSKIKLESNPSGTGTFTIQSPASSTDRTLTLPDEAGTVLTSGGAIDVDASAPADSIAIDSSGNVGVGTSSPISASNQKSVSINATNYSRLDMMIGGTHTARLTTGSANTSFGTVTSTPLVFVTADTERMRIDSSGNLLHRCTSLPSGSVRNCFGSDVEGILHVSRNGTGTRDAMKFFNDNGQIGSIQLSGSTTYYQTSSDYRLKEDWQPMSGSIDRLKNLNPVNFAWKADGSRVDGFLAHEAAEVVPECVTIEKDAMRTEEYEVTPAVLDDDGNVVTEAVMGTREVPDYQGIDQAKLVPLLTAALQEAVAKIEALETRIAALEVTP
jgi:hypothetical protein